MHKMLDRFADKFVKNDLNYVAHLFGGNVAPGDIADISVLPMDIQKNIERAIDALRQSCVVVAHKVGEGATGNLHELHSDAPALVSGNDYLLARTRKIELSRGKIV